MGWLSRATKVVKGAVKGTGSVARSAVRTTARTTGALTNFRNYQKVGGALGRKAGSIALIPSALAVGVGTGVTRGVVGGGLGILGRGVKSLLPSGSKARATVAARQEEYQPGPSGAAEEGDSFDPAMTNVSAYDQPQAGMMPAAGPGGYAPAGGAYDEGDADAYSEDDSSGYVEDDSDAETQAFMSQPNEADMEDADYGLGAADYEEAFGDWKSDLWGGVKKIGSGTATFAKDAGKSALTLTVSNALNKLGLTPTASVARQSGMSMGKMAVIGAAVAVPVLYLATRKRSAG
jgi:hypothetical protein